MVEKKERNCIAPNAILRNYTEAEFVNIKYL